MADSWMLTDTQMRDVAHKLNTDPWLIKPTPLQYLEAGALAQAKALIAEIEKHMIKALVSTLPPGNQYMALPLEYWQQLKQEVNDG